VASEERHLELWREAAVLAEQARWRVIFGGGSVEPLSAPESEAWVDREERER